MSKLTDYYKAGAVWAHSFDSPQAIRRLGTLTGTPTIVDTPYGRAWDCPRAQRVTFPNPANGVVSVFALAKPDIALQYQFLFDWRPVLGDTGYVILRNTGVLLGSSGTEYVNGQSADASWRPTWQSYAVTGITVDGATVAVAGGNDDSYAASTSFEGHMARAAIFPGTLTAADVLMLSQDKLTAYRAALRYRWRCAATAFTDDAGGVAVEPYGSPTLTRADRGYGITGDNTNYLRNASVSLCGGWEALTILVKAMKPNDTNIAYLFSNTGKPWLRIDANGNLRVNLNLPANGGDANASIMAAAAGWDRTAVYGMTYDGRTHGSGVVTGYLDGVAGPPNTTTWAAGGPMEATPAALLMPYYNTVRLDDVRIYNEVLTPLQIKHATYEMMNEP